MKAKISYPMGMRGWKLAAKLGIPLKVSCEAMFDKEAQVYVATCQDFKPALGIGTEGRTPEELNERLQECFAEEFYEIFGEYKNYKVIPTFTLVTFEE